MNKSIFLFLFQLLLLLTSCKGQDYSDAALASVEERKPDPHLAVFDTARINTEHSEIAWKGTKMRGRGKHTGIVPIKEGYLLFHNSRLWGGTVTANMTNIGITDIPPEQPEPIRILIRHLEDPSFFDVDRYPAAEFSFTNVEYITDRELIFSGNLTIKDVTKNITVSAFVDSTGHTFTTRFRINRFDWNIAYRGGFGATRFAARNYVDKYMELNVIIDISE